MADTSSVITLEYRGRVAVVTINNEKKLNALNQSQYYAIAQKLREIATHDEVYVTVLLAKGRFFSACALKFLRPLNTYSHTRMLTGSTFQRRRRLHIQGGACRRDRPQEVLAAVLRRLQPQHHRGVLHPPQDPRRRP